MSVQIGICQWSIPAVGTEDRLALAARLGLQGVEPDLGPYEQHFPLAHRDEQGKYREMRESLGITYPSLAVNALCEHGMSQPQSRAVVEMAITKAVETAVALDIPIVQLPSFVKGDIASDEDFENTVACLRYACRCAQGTSVIIGSENALPAERQLEMIDAVGSESFRIYFDTRNLYSMKGYDSVRILETMMPYVCEVHIKDGVDDGPSCLLGQGNSGFFDSLEILRNHDYAGWLLLENNYTAIARETGMPLEDLLVKDIATVKAVM